MSPHLHLLETSRIQKDFSCAKDPPLVEIEHNLLRRIDHEDLLEWIFGLHDESVVEKSEAQKSKADLLFGRDRG